MKEPDRPLPSHPAARRSYQRPRVSSERFAERKALACAKMPLQTQGCTNNPGTS